MIDLGNDVKTNSQLTLPMLGKSPFPGVLLVHGSGAVDMNEQIGKTSARFWQMALYISERGFAVLRYDKQGVGPDLTISNSNVWGIFESKTRCSEGLGSIYAVTLSSESILIHM